MLVILSFLKILSLIDNSFHNEIPSKIDRLRRLQFLQMYNDAHIGKIPRNLSPCTNLKIISIGRNHLDGEIPTTLGTLSKLRYEARVRFGTRVRVRVRVRVRDSAIFEKGGCGCGRTRRLKNY